MTTETPALGYGSCTGDINIGTGDKSATGENNIGIGNKKLHRQRIRQQHRRQQPRLQRWQCICDNNVSTGDSNCTGNNNIGTGDSRCADNNNFDIETSSLLTDPFASAACLLDTILSILLDKHALV